MKHYITYIVATTLLTTLLFSQEIFLNNDWATSKGIYSKTQSYCHPTKEGNTFCQKDVLSYPVFTQAPDKNIVRIIETIIEKEKIDFTKGDLKKSVLENLKDESYQPSGTWETANALDLFTVTATTFTLVTDDSGYTGGAHGYFSTSYNNYKHDGTSLKLSDLLKRDSNATLHKVAEQVYRDKAGLKAHESLLNDNWFDNKFVLTPNFAITQTGLLFHYNSYEIKPYAAGHTTFLLPYSAIRSLIDPKGALAAYLKEIKNMQRSFVNEDLAKISLYIKRINDSQVQIMIDETRLGYAEKSWLSLSFPQLKSKKSVKNLSTKGFSSTHIYPKGSKVYHKEKRKAVKSHYLLIEGETLKEENNVRKQMTLLVTVPKDIKALTIRLRASFKTGKTLKNMPEETYVKGQQGFENYQIIFPLKSI